MKNPIVIIALLLCCGLGCNKFDNTPVSAPANTNLNEVSATDRDDDCCVTLVVSSTYFGGLTICGVAEMGDYCRFCNKSCGYSCGYSRHFPDSRPDPVCVVGGCPFRVTNDGIAPVQIFFTWLGGQSAPVWIDPNDHAYFLYDCNGNMTICDETACDE